jgi:hypothetical protein
MKDLINVGWMAPSDVQLPTLGLHQNGQAQNFLRELSPISHKLHKIDRIGLLVSRF